MLPYRLTQSHVERSDYKDLATAITERREIHARELEFLPSDLSAIRGQLGKDTEGRDFFERWRFAGARFFDDCNFNRMHFRATHFEGATFGAKASFRDCHFGRADFRDAEFGDGASFERSSFGARANFHSARFGDRAKFSHCQFGAAQFFAARFGIEASFADVTFSGSARFNSARFGARPNFTAASFPSSTDFGGASFGEKAQMAKAQFAGGPNFLGTTFGPRARLTDWRVAGDLNMRSAHFLGEMSLSRARVVGNASFDHAHFHDSVDFGDVDVERAASFAGASLYRPDRLGPLQVARTLDLTGLICRSACLFEIGAGRIDLADARFLAPARISIIRGEVFLERVESDARLVITAAPAGHRARLLSVRGTDLEAVVVSGLDVAPLCLAGAEGIDGLRLESGASFEPSPRGLRTHREVIAEEHAMRATPTSSGAWFPPSTRGGAEPPAPLVDRLELARIYRGLRKAREDMRDAPGAADFYYGEMEMRRLHAARRSAARVGAGPMLLHAGTFCLLQLYRVVGGYGVRPSRPFALALIVLAALGVQGAELIQLESPGPDHTVLVTDPDFQEALVFVVRSALLLPTSSDLDLSTGAEWVQIAARLLGPVLIGLFAFGIRARVHR